MYAVSEEYKTAMKQPVQQFGLKGTVGDVSFTEENILSGSFSITNQCSGTENIEIGQVYIGELDATFLNLPITRYRWKGQEITPSFGLKLADGTYEYIPLGVFTVDTADWSSSGVVVKAYDHMALLDKSCNTVLTEVTAYEAIQIISEATGVEFGNTQEEIESFANGTTLFSETTTNDVETWRDLVSWLAQFLGCYATAGRDGEIYFRQYGDTAIDTIDTSHRLTGCTFSDFETRYTGLSVVNMDDSTTSYYGLDVDDGLTMNLGSNPLLQYGLEATKEEMRRAILNALTSIDYVPFKATAIGNPAYDLGDVLVFSDGIADGSKKYCITKYTFTYNGTYEMEGVGKDPALSTARSKTDKNIIGLLSNTDENTLIHYQFTNSRAVQIGDGEKKSIASIRFATATRASEVSLWAEVLLDTAFPYAEPTGEDDSTDSEEEVTLESLSSALTTLTNRVDGLEEEQTMTATVSYTLNGTEISYSPVETYNIDGAHILTLHYFIGSVEPNTIYTFVIYLAMSGGSVQLPKGTVNAVIEGVGLAGSAGWDGNIYAEDEFEPFRPAVVEMTDSGTTAFVDYSPASASDVINIDLSPLYTRIIDSGNVTTEDA